MNKVNLVQVKGPTSIYIDVEITDEGDLLFSGQDIGKAPEEFFGDSDYEYWLLVKAAQKDQLLLALIERFYSGNTRVISELREFLNARGIANEFDSYS
ncbi:MAG: hypothetical protein PVH65_10090 [Chloroflexota bacterium]|jgi:hypothetical protein